MSTDHVVVYTTTQTAEQADALALVLAESFLVACVTVLPGAKSYYHWQGTLEISQECVLMMKTQATLLPRLIEFLKANHPYTEPEIIAVPIVGGSESYLKWVDAVTNASKSEQDTIA